MPGMNSLTKSDGVASAARSVYRHSRNDLCCSHPSSQLSPSGNQKEMVENKEKGLFINCGMGDDLQGVLDVLETAAVLGINLRIDLALGTGRCSSQDTATPQYL